MITCFSQIISCTEFQNPPQDRKAAPDTINLSPNRLQNKIDSYWDAFHYFDTLYPDQKIRNDLPRHVSQNKEKNHQSTIKYNSGKSAKPLTEAQKQRKYQYNKKYKKDIREMQKLGVSINHNKKISSILLIRSFTYKLPRINEEKRIYKIENKEMLKRKRREMENKSQKKYYTRKGKDLEWKKANQEAKNIRRRKLIKERKEVKLNKENSEKMS